LDDLGYTGADGRTLLVDGIAGRNTRHAIDQFQRDHRLPHTGSPDAKTHAAIEAAGLTMASRRHPAHLLYRDAISAVADLDSDRGIAPGEHSLALAGAVAAAAARSGLSHVHRVEMGRDGRCAQAVEFRGGVDIWSTNATSMPIEVSRVLAQPLDVSSRQAAEAMEARAMSVDATQRERAPTRTPAL
jgi:hypothetical protein